MLIYAGGEYIPEGAPFIGAEDRSFRFGDGIFDTAIVHNGRIYDLPAHLARLSAGLEFFRIPLDLSPVNKICETLVKKNDVQTGYVRIIVSRGENAAGAVGYLPGDAKPLLVVQTTHRPLPEFGAVSLAVSQHRASLRIPCKTNSAALYTLSLMQARDEGCGNALILDAQGRICETASGNIFWVKDGALHTPAADLPFVPGTISRKVAAFSLLPIREGHYTLADLAGAEEMFMSNVGGIITRIKSVAGVDFSPKGDALATVIREKILQDIEA